MILELMLETTMDKESGRWTRRSNSHKSTWKLYIFYVRIAIGLSLYVLA